MSTEIKRISATDDVFSNPQFLEDRLIFNYIDNARQNDSTEFYSDGHRAIICRKKDHNSVWVWTDNDVQNSIDTVIAIANTIREFDTAGLEFFTKPQLAQVFSDMYALVSNDLDYQVKNEFSLGAYRFDKSELMENESITVLRYNKKFHNALRSFYIELKDEFSWSEDKVDFMVNRFVSLDTYLLLKNSQILSVCVISDDSDNCSSIRSVATKADQRNNGYATYLTNKSACLHSKNGSTVMLYANDGNKSAISAFTKAGFNLLGKVHLIKS